MKKAKFTTAAIVGLDLCPGLRGAATFKSLLAAILFAKNVAGMAMLFDMNATGMSDAMLRMHGFVPVGEGVYANSRYCGGRQ